MGSGSSICPARCVLRGSIRWNVARPTDVILASRHFIFKETCRRVGAVSYLFISATRSEADHDGNIRRLDSNAFGEYLYLAE